MAFASVSFAKVGVIGLMVAVVVAGTWVVSQDAPVLSTPRSKSEAPPYRRGDDPTYAEELKRMAALLQDMGYQLKQSENRRAVERDELKAQIRAEAQKAIRQSQQEIERLNQALQGARDALDQKIQAAADDPRVSALREQINQLTTTQETLRQQLTEGLAQAAALPPAAPPEGPPAPTDERPEANRITQPPSVDANTEALRARLAGSGGPGKDAGPGDLQIAPGMLEVLEGLPGMDGVADRFRASSPPAPGFGPGVRGSAKTALGLSGEYVTLTPYVAGANDRARPASATDTAERLTPKRFPFTLKSSPDGASAVIPVHTIPDAATLVHNSTMTPLIGRVPVKGQLRDPFRFKLITGATNLATNGHRIPGIVNAVWTGYAVGVREQSCVRAYIDTVTFTFTDGRLHTVNRGKGQTEQAASVRDHLGYLTDAWGKPCLRGRYFNNAGDYLQDRGFAAFLDGLANAYSQSQVTTDRDAGVLSSYVSGNTYEYALGRGVSGATGEIADFVAERAADAFDVVYTPPGIDVQIFIETAIPIDYDTDGRRLHYRYASGGSHAALD